MNQLLNDRPHLHIQINLVSRIIQVPLSFIDGRLTEAIPGRCWALRGSFQAMPFQLQLIRWDLLNQPSID